MKHRFGTDSTFVLLPLPYYDCRMETSPAKRYFPLDAAHAPTADPLVFRMPIMPRSLRAAAPAAHGVRPERLRPGSSLDQFNRLCDI